MNEQVIISSKELNITINTLGAEITSVKKNNEELMWQGDPAIWSGHAPLLFPICGGLKDDKYFYQGNEYSLPKHGFARRSEFELETKSENSATFLLKSNNETKKSYPFDFELRVIYTISGSELSVKYDVKNLTDGDMYFSIGAHEAYSCPNGIEEYSVIFEKEEDLTATQLDGNYLTYKTNEISKNATELPLKNEYFSIDALVFLNIKSRKVILKNNITGKEIKVEFDGFPYLLIWTKPYANYICIEPWCGIPDFMDSDCDITHKTGILKISKSKGLSREHKITF